MTNPTVYRMVSVNNNLAVAIKNNTKHTECVLEKEGARGDEQRWIVEYGDADSKVAVQSVANGEYLRCNFDAVTKNASIGMGEKYWWEVQDGRNPNTRVKEYRSGCLMAPDPRGTYFDHDTGGNEISALKWKVSYMYPSL